MNREGHVDGAVCILLCAARPLLGIGIARVIDESPLLNEVRQDTPASSRDEAIDTLRRTEPAIVVIDEGLDGFEQVVAAAETSTGAPDIVLVVADGADERVRRLLAHGVIGVVRDTVEPRQLVATLLAVIDGQVSIPARLATLCFDSAPADASVSPQMSPEDVRLLHLLVESRSSREAAELFHVSEATIKKRLGRLFRRIGVSDRTQAAVWAIRAGVVGADAPPVVGVASLVGRRGEPRSRDLPDAAEGSGRRS